MKEVKGRVLDMERMAPGSQPWREPQACDVNSQQEEGLPQVVILADPGGSVLHRGKQARDALEIRVGLLDQTVNGLRGGIQPKGQPGKVGIVASRRENALGETACGIGPQAFPRVKAGLGEQLDGVHFDEYLPDSLPETEADFILGFYQGEESFEAVKTTVWPPAMPACRPCF